jgi:hypothetical protein
MRHRLGFSGVMACLGATLVGAGAGCSGSIVGPGAVTTLPASDPVASDADQFCSDLTSYVVGVIPSLAPLICAESVQGANCENEYSACVAGYSAALASDGGAASLTGAFKNCPSSVAACKGVTVGQISQCVSDEVNAIQTASNAITEQSACGGNKVTFPSKPASCSALPAACASFGTSMVSVGSSSPAPP